MRYLLSLLTVCVMIGGSVRTAVAQPLNPRLVDGRLTGTTNFAITDGTTTVAWPNTGIQEIFFNPGSPTLFSGQTGGGLGDDPMNPYDVPWVARMTAKLEIRVLSDRIIVTREYERSILDPQWSFLSGNTNVNAANDVIFEIDAPTTFAMLGENALPQAVSGGGGSVMGNMLTAGTYRLTGLTAQVDATGNAPANSGYTILLPAPSAFGAIAVGALAAFRRRR